MARLFSAEAIEIKRSRLPQKLLIPKESPAPKALITKKWAMRKMAASKCKKQVSGRIGGKAPKERKWVSELARRLRRKYGMTITEFEAMLEQQQGVCAICGEFEQNKTKNTLSVDHCHATGQVRGLLCSHCNTMLGHARDDLRILENAINYLKKVLDKSN